MLDAREHTERVIFPPPATLKAMRFKNVRTSGDSPRGLLCRAIPVLASSRWGSSERFCIIRTTMCWRFSSAEDIASPSEDRRVTYLPVLWSEVNAPSTVGYRLVN
jgi:hypothetical protein